MSDSPFIEESGREEYMRSGFERLMDSLKDFWNQFKREKIGLVGILILLSLVGITINGVFFGDPSTSLTGGDNPRGAKPGWMAAFDSNSFPDRTLIDENFDTGATIGNTFDEEEQPIGTDTVNNVTTTNSSYLTATPSINSEQGFLNLSFTDTGKRNTTPMTPPKAKILLSKDIDWDEAKPPNGVNSYFTYLQTIHALEGEAQAFERFNQFRDAYTVATRVYIKSRLLSTTVMENTLEDQLGSVPDELVNKEEDYGILWTTKLPITDTDPDNPPKQSKTLNFRIMYYIFQEFSQLELNIVTTFKPRTMDPETRGNGTYSFLIDKWHFTGRSYYSGIFGTTPRGADLLTLIGSAFKNDTALGLSTTLISLFLGIFLGLVAGYYKGKTDESIMRVADMLLVLPTLPFMIVLAAIFRESEVSTIWGVLFSLSFIAWAGTARLIRSQVLKEREKPYIEAAKASGVPNIRIIFGHVFPNLIGLVMYQIMLSLQSIIYITAGLTFLGMGPSWASFGRLLQQVSGVVLGEGGEAAGLQQVRGGGRLSMWWLVIFPGLFLFLYTTGLVFVGMAAQRVIGRERGA